MESVERYQARMSLAHSVQSEEKNSRQKHTDPMFWVGMFDVLEYDAKSLATYRYFIGSSMGSTTTVSETGAVGSSHEYVVCIGRR